MITTQAACCLISSKPGVCSSTTLGVRMSETVKCAHCAERYEVEYQSGEAERIPDYEEKLTVAQQKVNDSHSALRHPAIISIWGI